MTLAELPDGGSVFIDANILIYHFGGRSPECKSFLERCARRELLGYASTSILAEVLHRLMIAEAIAKGLVTAKMMDFLLLLLRFMIELLFALTGEILLFFLTLGHHKPRWDLYASENAGRFVLFSEVSTWIGVVFWIIAVMVIYQMWS